MRLVERLRVVRKLGMVARKVRHLGRTRFHVLAWMKDCGSQAAVV